MEPIAIAIAFVAALIVVTRVPLVVAPTATTALYSRLFSNPQRVRLVGFVVLVFVAIPLVITARLSRDVHDDIIWFEGFGWYIAIVVAWMLLAPTFWQRLLNWFYTSASAGVMRGIGVFSLAFGLALGWIAFFVL